MIALWLWLAFSAAPAKAHENGAILDVLVASDQHAEVLLTSYGIVRAGDDGLRYECPSRSGRSAITSSFRATVAASAQVTAVIDEGALAISTDGCAYEHLDLGEAIGVAVSDDRVFVLVDDGAATTLRVGTLRVGTEHPNTLWTPVHTFDARPIEIAVTDGVLTIATLRPMPAIYRARVETPEALERIEVEGDVEWLGVRAIDEGALAIEAIRDGKTELSWIDDRKAPLRAVSLHGPVRIGDQWLAIADERVATRIDGSDWQLGDPSTLRCLVARGGAVFGCAQGDLVRVERVDRDVSLRVRDEASLDRLVGPTRCAPREEEAERVCALEWQHVAIELGISMPDAPRDAAESPAVMAPGSSCAVAPGRASARWLGLAVALAGFCGARCRVRRSLRRATRERALRGQRRPRP